MKTLLKIFKIKIIIILVFANNLFAQDISGLTFKYQDSIAVELDKYRIQMTDFPLIDPCERVGTVGPIRIGITDPVPAPHIPGDGTGTIMPPPGEPIPQMGDINIYWIHGLNGDITSWERAAHATEHGLLNGDPSFPARRAVSIIGNEAGTQTYGETGGITYASTHMRNVANKSEIVHTERDYIIAHSQGGIVAKEWLRNIDEKTNYPNNVHGLVTFGTPHMGAMILNNTRGYLDGSKNPQNHAIQFFEDACNSLTDVYLTEKIYSNFFTSLLVSKEMKNEILVKVCKGVFANTIVPFALDNYHKPTTDDFYVGSPFLTTGNPLASPSNSAHPTGLIDYTLKVPLVQFYGVEESPIIWKFFSSTLKLGEDEISGGNVNKEFGYDKDDQLEQKVSEMLNDFQAKFNTASKHYDYWNNRACWTLATPMTWAFFLLCKLEKEDGKKKNREKMHAYDKAIVWLSNADDYYLTQLIGAKVTETNRYCLTEKSSYCNFYRPTWQGQVEVRVFNKPTVTTQYLSNNSPCPPSKSIEKTTNCFDDEKTTTVYKTNSYMKPNDGTVLAESAAGTVKVAPGITMPVVVLMPATNHIQMRNSQVTKDCLNALYNGEYGWEFRISPR